MTRRKLAVLVGIGLLGLVVARQTKADDKPVCKMKVVSFTSVAYMVKATTVYQFRVVIDAQFSPSLDVGAWGNFYGVAEHEGMVLSSLHPVYQGRNIYTLWIGASGGGKTEEVDLSFQCTDNNFNSLPEVAHTAKTTVYGPGDQQPLVQPWTYGCPDALVIDSRGSGEPKGLFSPPASQFLEQLREDKFGSVYYPSNFVVAQLANPYPAAGSPTAMLAAVTHLPWWYHSSVKAGKKWLASELTTVEKKCPSTKIYLTGYSQGAQVAADVFENTAATTVNGVVLFGDPYFNPEDPSAYGNFNHKLNGLFGKRDAFDSSLVYSFCHWGDPVCQGKTQAIHGFRNHDDYALHHEPQWAADQLAKQ